MGYELAEWAIDSEAMTARGIIINFVLVKSNQLVKKYQDKTTLAR